MSFLVAPVESSFLTISMQIANVEVSGHLHPAAVLKWGNPMQAACFVVGRL